MTVRLTRLAYGDISQELGISIDDDGQATSWTTFGSRAGRFGRALSAAELAALESALISAKASGVPAPEPAGRPVPPSGVTERLSADGLPDVVLTSPAPPAGALGELIGLLRGLEEDLADSPVAALELVVEGSPLAARLQYLGVEPVQVRMDTLSVQATVFGSDGEVVDSVSQAIEVPGVDGPLAAGWTLPLLDRVGVDAHHKDGYVSVVVGTAEMDVLGDGVLREIELGWVSR